MTALPSRRASANTGACADPRWTLLSLVQKARDMIGLKDRDITVLRGLLTLIPAERWVTAPMVHASNRCLQERCDGIDERTLRRRLARLCELGLIIRRQSPNRKRYQLRGADGAVLIAYGFDLSPLRDGRQQLEDMAAETEAEARQVAALRGQLRHRLFELDSVGCLPETVAPRIREAGLMLRRKASAEQLQAMLSELQAVTQGAALTADTPILTDADGQNDRQSQKNLTDLKEEPAESIKQRSIEPNQSLTLFDCIAAAPSAIEFSPEQPRSWTDLDRLTDFLGPSLGLDGHLLRSASTLLGCRGKILAVLGLAEAGGRILQPRRYFLRLLDTAASGGLDLARMFRSLTLSGKRRFPAGNSRNSHPLAGTVSV